MAFRISAASSSDRRAYGALKTRFRRLDSRLLNPAGQPCQSFATQHPDEILTDPRCAHGDHNRRVLQQKYTSVMAFPQR
jgi:hypothetical protein